MSTSIMRKEKKLEVKQTRCGRWMVSIPFGLVAMFIENLATRKRYLCGTFRHEGDAELVRDAEISERAERTGREQVKYVIASNGLYAVDREPDDAMLYA